MLSYRAIFGGTHLYEPRLLVTVYEIGVISSKLMNRPECDLYAPPEGSAFGSLVLVGLVVKLLDAKLTIQGIVHCSVVKKCSYLF